jgi:hypothetical protein
VNIDEPLDLISLIGGLGASTVGTVADSSLAGLMNSHEAWMRRIDSRGGGSVVSPVFYNPCLLPLLLFLSWHRAAPHGWPTVM